MEILKIVLLGLAGAIVYGIVQDQVTARVCVEYFTIGHPRIIESEDPTILAFTWGVVATWWVGLPMGLLLSVAARAGRRPPLPASRLVAPLAVALGIMAALSLVAGTAGYLAASSGTVRLLPPLDRTVPEAKHAAFLADLWAHSAAYVSGCGAGLGLCAWAWRRRGTHIETSPLGASAPRR